MPGRFPGPLGASSSPAAIAAGTLARTYCFPPGPLSTTGGHWLAQWLIGGESPMEAESLAEALDAEPAVRFIPPDTTHYQYDMINDPGPLARTVAGMKAPPAANFSAGKYNETVLTKPTVLFRAQPKALLKIDGDGQYDWNPQARIGGWFSPEPPASAAQARIDGALLEHWIDPHDMSFLGSSAAETLLAVRLPAGVKVYYGPTGAQGGVHVGGMHKIQVYVPDLAGIAGVRILAEEPLAPATMQGVVDTLRRYR